MKCLCLETATDACSLALLADGQLYCRHERAPRRHAERVLSRVQSLLEEAGLAGRQLDALAVGVGPGSFTGLRIAVGVCQGLAWAWDLPVLALSTFAVMAQGAAAGHSRAAVAMDARMGELYWGLYQRDPRGLMQALHPPEIRSPRNLSLPDGGPRWHGLGQGFQLHRAVLLQGLGSALGSVDADALPNARDMVPLAQRCWQDGQLLDPAQLQVQYLRQQVAKPAG